MGKFGLQEDGSYILDEHEMDARSCCISCKHLKSMFNQCCKAFDEIPSKFVDAKSVHDSVIEGQKGTFVYESV